jgi:hypothetical protein
MLLLRRFVPAVLVSCVALLSPHCPLLSQATDTAPRTASADIPEAPQPRLADAAEPVNAAPQSTGQPSLSGQDTQAAPSQPAPAPSAQAESSSQTPAQQTDAQKGAPQTSEEQLKQQEHQRVMGVMATFNTTTNRNALPLSPRQKFQLFFKGQTDPWPFFLAGVVSGIGQADDSYPEWGQGAQGYAKRFGAAYSDSFIGNFFGNAVLPVVLHEDPRYFQKGTGSVTKRFLWAASSTVWCRRDNATWGPNYSNVGGNLIGAAIARTYYPASERTVGSTIEDGLTVSLEGIVGAEVIEFWPDLARHMKHKHDEKLARQAAAQGQTAQPAANSKVQ